MDSAQDNETGSSSSDGWDWDPYYGTYTFIPTDGTIFYSPFGWGFYSPYGVGYAPFGFYGHYYHHFDDDYHHWDHGDHHEAHYYDHFDHGAYRGPGSGYYDGRGAFVGRYHGGELAGGYRMQPGEGFHPGRGGEGFHGGEGYGGRGGEGSHAGHGTWGVVAKGSTERAALAGLAQWEAGAPIAVAALAALTEPEAGPLMAEVAAVTAESSLDESRWTLRVNWRNLAPFNKATYVEKRNSFDQRTCFVIRDIAVPT